MAEYVALMRGINVGHAKRVAMSDLRELLEGLGYGEVRTLLNSGNAVFKATGGSTPDAMGKRIEAALSARTGVSARVLVLSAEVFSSVVGENELMDQAGDPARLLVAFCGDPARLRELAPLMERKWHPEALVVGRFAAYLWCAGRHRRQRIGRGGRAGACGFHDGPELGDGDQDPGGAAFPASGEHEGKAAGAKGMKRTRAEGIGRCRSCPRLRSSRSAPGPMTASELRRAAFGSAMFFCLAPGGVAGLAPYLISGWRQAAEVPAAARGVAVALIVIGLAVLVECFVRFVVRGRGTPAPVAPPTQLVVSGLYRHVRNPMYVALVAIVAGQAVWLGSRPLALYTVVLWGLFHLRVVSYEEPVLRRQFGAAFEAYRSGVPRWVPRLSPWRSG